MTSAIVATVLPLHVNNHQVHLTLLKLGRRGSSRRPNAYDAYLFCQHAFILKTRSPKVLFDLIQRTKVAVRELDNQVGSRFKKLLVESPAANHHASRQPTVAAAAAAEIDDEDDDDDSSVSAS